MSDSMSHRMWRLSILCRRMSMFLIAVLLILFHRFSFNTYFFLMRNLSIAAPDTNLTLAFTSNNRIYNEIIDSRVTIVPDTDDSHFIFFYWFFIRIEFFFLAFTIWLHIPLSTKNMAFVVIDIKISIAKITFN